MPAHLTTRLYGSHLRVTAQGSQGAGKCTGNKWNDPRILFLSLLLLLLLPSPLPQEP